MRRELCGYNATLSSRRAIFEDSALPRKQAAAKLPPPRRTASMWQGEGPHGALIEPAVTSLPVPPQATGRPTGSAEGTRDGAVTSAAPGGQGAAQPVHETAAATSGRAFAALPGPPCAGATGSTGGPNQAWPIADVVEEEPGPARATRATSAAEPVLAWGPAAGDVTRSPPTLRPQNGSSANAAAATESENEQERDSGEGEEGEEVQGTGVLARITTSSGLPLPASPLLPMPTLGRTRPPD